MRQIRALITVVVLYTVFCLSINHKFANDFMQYLIDN